MIERLLRWLGLRPRPDDALTASGRLDVTVDGERWTPVTSLAGRGPDDLAYIVRIDGDAATITFGDGTTGRRPPEGSRIGSTYRPGTGAEGNVSPEGAETDPLRSLLDLLARMADELAAAQEQIANEAFIETASGSVIPLSDTAAIRQVISEAGHEDTDDRIQVRIRFRPWTDRDRP